MQLWHYPFFKVLTLEELISFSHIILFFLFYLFQFLSNFLKYSSSNFLSSLITHSFWIPPHLYLVLLSIFYLFISSCHLTFASNLPLNLFTNFFTFSKSSFLFHVLFSAINSFYLTKYLFTPHNFLLFNIFSTSYSSTPSTSTGFLYFSILLIFTTR